MVQFKLYKNHKALVVFQALISHYTVSILLKPRRIWDIYSALNTLRTNIDDAHETTTKTSVMLYRSF